MSIKHIRLQSAGTTSFILLFLIVVLTAAGASPLETQTVHIGPYRLLLSFYNLPRAGQQLNMTIESNTPDVAVQFSQTVLKPAPGTHGNTVLVQLTPDRDNKNVYDLNVTPPIRGKWLLQLAVNGTSGLAMGNVPINVEGPPAIPTWLGWLIGLLPLALLMTIIWLQIGWYKARRERAHREMRQKPSWSLRYSASLED